MAETQIPKVNPDHRADSYSNADSYALGCEIRAVEEGHKAFFKSNGTDRWFDVISDTELHFADEGEAVVKHHTPRKHYRLTAEGRLVAGEWLVHIKCDCLSGQNRDHLPVSCKHGALVGRRLVNEGFARQVGNIFVLAPHLVPPPPVEHPCSSCGEPTTALVTCAKCKLKSL